MVLERYKRCGNAVWCDRGFKCAREISDKKYAYHVKVCHLSAIGCKECLVTFSAKKYYLQHNKRVHMVPTVPEKRDVEMN